MDDSSLRLRLSVDRYPRWRAAAPSVDQGLSPVVSASVDLAQITVVVGANGTGKTNLYRALRLISLGARGELAITLLREGGMPSVIYAGERRRRKGEPTRVVVGVTVEELSYELSLGLPSTVDGFCLDPEVKEEWSLRPCVPPTWNTPSDAALGTLRRNTAVVDGSRVRRIRNTMNGSTADWTTTRGSPRSGSSRRD